MYAVLLVGLETLRRGGRRETDDGGELDVNKGIGCGPETAGASVHFKFYFRAQKELRVRVLLLNRTRYGVQFCVVFCLLSYQVYQYQRPM